MQNKTWLLNWSTTFNKKIMTDLMINTNELRYFIQFGIDLI